MEFLVLSYQSHGTHSCNLWMPVKYIRENGVYLGPHSVLAKVEMDYSLEDDN